MDIEKFLETPVPPGGTPAWSSWQSACDVLDCNAAPAMINALQSGSLLAQEAALLCLRRHGYEAWADGYGAHLKYRVRRVGESDWQHIQPEIIDP